MRQRRRSRLALISAAAGLTCLAFATPAWAMATTPLQRSNVPVLAPGGDPAGANRTVKIDDIPVDGDKSNLPHVGCTFAVKFFGFDEGEHANIVFTLQQEKPGPSPELLRRDNVLVSKDAAGGRDDLDEVFTFSVSQFGLDAYTPQNDQGYHIKLEVERIGAPGAGKHKVFWVPRCVEKKPPSSPPPSNPSSPPPSSPSNGGGVGGGGGSLPITGAAIGGLVTVGLGLVGAGITLVLLRRRRDAVEFEA